MSLFTSNSCFMQICRDFVGLTPYKCELRALDTDGGLGQVADLAVFHRVFTASDTDYLAATYRRKKIIQVASFCLMRGSSMDTPPPVCQ